ncbi:MAG: hypothetical protein WCD65_25020 [Pseudolabrys sp.]|jgi:hypothetical protein
MALTSAVYYPSSDREKVQSLDAFATAIVENLEPELNAIEELPLVFYRAAFWIPTCVKMPEQSPRVRGQLLVQYITYRQLLTDSRPN